jgi:AbrB family looped-hinge helix DNA binding protein
VVILKELVMNVVKVLRHGQITLPKTVREALGIKEGDILEIELERFHLILKTKILVDKEESGLTVSGHQKPSVVAEPEELPTRRARKVAV